ncbi:MAG: hypothetical protein RJB61_1471 [Actinomycetota bacterium]
MNDSEIFDRLQRIDPLLEGARITPAHSAQALTLMESIMTTELESTSRDRVTAGDTAPETTGVAQRSRRRWFAPAGIGAAVAAVAVAVVLPGIGASSTALAWTPTPRVSTESDAASARQACVVPEGTESQPGDAGGRTGNAATEPAVPTPAPVELGPLAALDMRGNGGLAVFAGGEGIVMCMLRVVDGTAEYAGLVSTAVLPQSPGGLTVDGVMSTYVDTPTAVTMLTGTAGSAERVEIEVAGLDAITATLVDGRFAAWWPENTSSDSSLDEPITIRSFAADGTEVAEFVWTLDRDTTDAPRGATP